MGMQIVLNQYIRFLNNFAQFSCNFELTSIPFN